MSESANLHPIEASVIHRRRERVFLVLAGLFLGSMTMLNILGISRFLDLSFTLFGLEIPLKIAVGVLPYPITFLCTDYISEIYGKQRANFVVWVGLGLNVWVISVLWLAANLPPVPELDAAGLPSTDAYDFAFYRIQTLTQGAVLASMIAYLAAQLCDVHVFHFWKKLTKGKHLWLRNNGSTLVSQFIDTFAVITITHFMYENALPINESDPIWPQLWVFIGSGYVFKVVAAMVDTVPFYVGTRWLRNYLEIPAEAELREA